MRLILFFSLFVAMLSAKESRDIDGAKKRLNSNLKDKKGVIEAKTLPIVNPKSNPKNETLRKSFKLYKSYWIEAS